MSDDEREEKELDLTSPEVVTKYKSAAEIVNKALQLVLSKCKPKAKIVDICEEGNSYIREQSGNMYKNVKKKIERGIALPTCISVNNTICHFSPLASDETEFEEGDVLKIDMGCHIDEFIAVVAHTHVLQKACGPMGNEEEQMFPKKTIPPFVKAISGSIGGTVEACCLQPIDVIKTRLQLDRSGAYKGIIHCGTTIVRTEGVRALWKGLTPFATHLTLKYALRMGSNAVLQTAFKDSETGKLSNKGRFLAGFGAGVLEALIIVTPFEVVKIRLQQQRGFSPELLKYKGPIHCARTIIREEGFHGLWAGAAPTVMRNGTNQAAMFTAKNAFDSVLWKKQEGDGKVLQPWQSMISGFLAGTAGPVCTGPFDVVKTRLMAQSRVGGMVKYKGMFHAIRTIFAEEGLLALWKGLLPRLMRIPPGQAIMWTVADQVIGLYEK